MEKKVKKALSYFEEQGYQVISFNKYVVRLNHGSDCIYIESDRAFKNSISFGLCDSREMTDKESENAFVLWTYINGWRHGVYGDIDFVYDAKVTVKIFESDYKKINKWLDHSPLKFEEFIHQLVKINEEIRKNGIQN